MLNSGWNHRKFNSRSYRGKGETWIKSVATWISVEFASMTLSCQNPKLFMCVCVLTSAWIKVLNCIFDESRMTFTTVLCINNGSETMLLVHGLGTMHNAQCRSNTKWRIPDLFPSVDEKKERAPNRNWWAWYQTDSEISYCFLNRSKTKYRKCISLTSQVTYKFYTQNLSPFHIKLPCGVSPRPWQIRTLASWPSSASSARHGTPIVGSFRMENPKNKWWFGGTPHFGKH